MNMRHAELRSAAEKATKGPWIRAGCRQKLIEDCLMVGPDTFLIAGIPIGRTDKSHAEAFRDAGYLAKVDPGTVLGLLDEIDTKAATIARLEGENARLRIALEPFADYIAGTIGTTMAGGMVITRGSSLARRQLTIGDCQIARAALASLASDEAKP